MSGIDPIEKSFTLPADPETAFRRYTAEMGEWWPLYSHSVFDEEADTIVCEPGVGGRIYERSSKGDISEWGRVSVWTPPERLAFTWYPGREPALGQLVEMRFEAVDLGTRVRLVHSGWETLGPAGPVVRDGYDAGWEPVIACLRGSFDGSVR